MIGVQSGGWGKTAFRGFGWGFHGFCFGYVVYVLAYKPAYIATRNKLYETFPNLKIEDED